MSTLLSHCVRIINLCVHSNQSLILRQPFSYIFLKLLKYATLFLSFTNSKG